MWLIYDRLFWNFIRKEIAKSTISSRAKVSRFEKKYRWITKRYVELKWCEIKGNANKYIWVSPSKCHEDYICSKLITEFWCTEEEISEFTWDYFWWYA